VTVGTVLATEVAAEAFCDSGAGGKTRCNIWVEGVSEMSS
jgi:hypothetical protein